MEPLPVVWKCIFQERAGFSFQPTPLGTASQRVARAEMGEEGCAWSLHRGAWTTRYATFWGRCLQWGSVEEERPRVRQQSPQLGSVAEPCQKPEDGVLSRSRLWARQGVCVSNLQCVPREKSQVKVWWWSLHRGDGTAPPSYLKTGSSAGTRGGDPPLGLKLEYPACCMNRA